MIDPFMYCSVIYRRHKLVTVSFSMTILASFLRVTPSPFEDILRNDLNTTDVFLLCWPFRLVRARPSMSSIICSRNAWSLVSMGTTEMSRTARNWPQLLRCSFSRRKKFQIKRLKSHKNEMVMTHQTGAP